MPASFWTSDHDAACQRTTYLLDLLAGDHERVLHTKDGGWKWPIYITLNWLKRLSHTYATLVWRTMPTFTTTPESAQEVFDTIVNQVHLWELVSPAQRYISALGQATFKLSWSRHFPKPVLRLWGMDHRGDRVPGEHVFWEADPGDEPHAVSFYREEVRQGWRGRNVPTTFRVRERFELTGNGVLVTNEAYLRDEASQEHAERVSLADLFPENPPADETTLPMDCLPAYRVLNGETAESDYTPDLISLQRATAALITQRQIAVILSTMPQLNVPLSAANADGTIDLSKFLVTYRDYGESAEDKLITVSLAGNSFNLENSERQYEYFREAYYELTGIAPAIDGMINGDGGGESGYARRLGMVKTECAVESRRRAWDGFPTWLGRAVPQLAQALPEPVKTYGLPVQEVVSTWGPAIPPDPDADSQRTERGVRGGWISQETAIRTEHPDWSEQQIAEEQARIQQEAEERTARQMASFAGMPAG